MSSYERELETIRHRAAAQGWRISQTTAGHWQFYAPNKHDIVTTSKTPSDYRSFANFIAHMKRAGYVAEEGQNGRDETAMEAAMREAQQAEAAPSKSDVLVNQEKRPSVAVLALDAIRARSPLGISFEDLTAVVRSKRPGTSNKDVSAALYNLKERQQVEQKERGWYRLRSTTPADVPDTGPTSPEPNAMTPPPLLDQPPAATSTDASATAPHPEMRLTREDEDDIAAIDEALAAISALERLAAAIPPALAALARIEGVVRRNREVEAKTQELMQLLTKTK
jgi:hypothetical protein